MLPGLLLCCVVTIGITTKMCNSTVTEQLMLGEDHGSEGKTRLPG